MTDSLSGSRKWIGLLSNVTLGNTASAATSATAVAPSTNRGRRLSGAKMRGSSQVAAPRPGRAASNQATSAGSSVTLANKPNNTPVPAISPSSETPINVVGMKE